ncbi:MAG TPA: HAMP domain-containing sensor histidine kinase [Chryseosolibacter sp.]|nr:HAMP domain-containing sensor histidine kinase [Chryseosolibacter sp.]
MKKNTPYPPNVLMRLRRALILFLVFGCCVAHGQNKHMVQVKTFDQSLQPVRNIEVSLNGKDYFVISNKGTAFVELEDSQLPPKTVAVRNEKLEAASWNYSKGILEIIIRQKSYKTTLWQLRDTQGAVVSNTGVRFSGKQPLSVTTDADGKFRVLASLDEEFKTTQFQVTDRKVAGLQLSEKENVLLIEPVATAGPAPVIANQDPAKEDKYFRDFDLSKLDSIQSLTVFYAIFKNYEIKRLSPQAKRKVDAKFHELVTELQDSVNRRQSAIIGRISDSSFVSDDVSNLLTQASQESQMLDAQREDFDEKLQLITEKIESSISKLKPEERNKLLADIALLEKVLMENESRFYKNHQDYRQLINSLKDRFFNVEDLETRLSASEQQRLEEQRVFRQRLIGILSVVILFGVMIILLIYLARKLKKQKKQLVIVNGEINRINENLESLVAERTKLLFEAHKELDTFLYRASHDLRGPVCSIMGLCNLAGHLPEKDAKAIIEKVVHTTMGMDRLLKKLSMISEINAPSNFSPIVLHERLARMHEEQFQTFIKVNNVSFNIDCPPDIVIESYPVLIDAILENVLENALFYSVLGKTSEPRVDFTASIIGDILEISVYDNGVGCDQRVKSNLFNMFFKGDVNSKGNGLGLYIVQKSLQTLAGGVMVESTPGEFTKVLIHLPLKIPADKQTSLISSGKDEVVMLQ